MLQFCFIFFYFPNSVWQTLFFCCISVCLIAWQKNVNNAWATYNAEPKKPDFVLFRFLFNAHFFSALLDVMESCFSFTIASLSHCLWSASQEELLFLLLLPVSRKWVTTTLPVSKMGHYDFTCVQTAISLFKKPTETVFWVWWPFKNSIFLDAQTIECYLFW